VAHSRPHASAGCLALRDKDFALGEVDVDHFDVHQFTHPHGSEVSK
jgi:hypothetical protein